jgi:hypothetical protein
VQLVKDVERTITGVFSIRATKKAHKLKHQPLERRALMRTLLISLAAATSALAFASPASAQYYPAPPPPGYGYGQGYGQGYGYQNNWGHVRGLQHRIDQLQRRIARLDNRDFLSEREARRLRQESRDIERRLRHAARYGLHPQEAAGIHRRIERLEFRIFRDANDRNRWARHGYNRWDDRDRDGRNDRWEDDRGRDHDGRWDR